MTVYQGLKSDTDVFTSWTVSIAQALGHGLNSVPREKGKAKGSASTSKPVPKVSTKDLRAHATYIANHKANITMPMDVFRAVKRAIASRKYQTRKYEREEEEESEDTVGHKEFTGVLEEVCEILSTRIHFKILVPNKDATQKKKTRKIDNLYSALELEETELDEATEINLPQLSASAPMKLPPARPFELELDTKEEILIRIECLKTDRTDLMTHIRLVVHRIYQGEVALAVASIVVGAAIASFKHEEEAIVSLAESIKALNLLELPDTNRTIYSQSLETLEDIWTAARNSSQYFIPLKRLHLRKPNITSVKWGRKEDFLAKYIPDAHIELELRNRTWENDSVRNVRLSQPLSPASLDDVTREIYRVLTDDWSPMTMSFAAEFLWIINSPDMANREDNDQLLLDQVRAITKTLREASDTGFKMDHRATKAVERLRTIQLWIDTSPVARQKYNLLRRLPDSHAMSGIHHDILPQLMITLEGRTQLLEKFANVPDPSQNLPAQQEYLSDFYDISREADFLRKRNPLYCGKLMMDLLLAYEEIGLASVNSGAVVLSMTHIYAALKQQKFSVGTWHDLEHVAETHVKTLFLGKFPADAQKAYNRLLLASGFSMKLVKSLENVCSKNERLGTKLKQAKASAGRDGTKDAWAMVSHPITQILRDYFNGKEPDLLRTMYRIDKEFMSRSGEKQPRSILDGEGIVAFLIKLEEELVEIGELLTINYISLARVCTELFQQMYEMIIAADASHGPVVASEEWKIPNHRGYGIALRVLGELEEAHLTRSKKKKAETPTADMVACVLGDYITRLEAERTRS